MVANQWLLFCFLFFFAQSVSNNQINKVVFFFTTFTSKIKKKIVILQLANLSDKRHDAHLKVMIKVVFFVGFLFFLFHKIQK